ncbi:MAG TPA: 3-deoxy-manno-octulosonate cytidylyltransferase [Terriglobales bacterium]|jgi:3-deoxy-manno-octulosonate cytidylyltransferase (CMP-KDO synthetase)|nr:3-deoxy-manno-octulosonate cytidylyltransferase [Terriglobales bacterium]
MKIIAVIPARLASMRLPRKMLREIHGKPLVVLVYQSVRASALLEDVIVATDSEEILAACEKHACNARMTSDKHRSGTERVHEVSQSVAADVYFNVQGDEPMIRADHIEVLARLMRNPDVPVGTLKTVAAAEDISNPNAVKVVVDTNQRALYFSRSTVPYDRDGSNPKYFKHLGIYAYRKPYLEKFVTLPESSLERAERLEQLRFLENGIPIYVAETAYDSIGVDTEEDFLRVSKLLAK